MNGFWLVKHWNGNKNDWQVAIYSKESYDNYKRPTLPGFEEDQRFYLSIDKDD